MSPLPPKVDIRQRIEHVCFVLATDLVVSAFPSGKSVRGTSVNREHSARLVSCMDYTENFSFHSCDKLRLACIGLQP
jgi:hypothetical protein